MPRNGFALMSAPSAAMESHWLFRAAQLSWSAADGSAPAFRIRSTAACCSGVPGFRGMAMSPVAARQARSSSVRPSEALAVEKPPGMRRAALPAPQGRPRVQRRRLELEGLVPFR